MLSGSIAPEIFGLYDVKKSLLLLMGKIDYNSRGIYYGDA